MHSRESRLWLKGAGPLRFRVFIDQRVHSPWVLGFRVRVRCKKRCKRTAENIAVMVPTALLFKVPPVTGPDATRPECHGLPKPKAPELDSGGV